MTAESLASDIAHVKLESESNFGGPKPTHYLARDREQFTPLIPLDELPAFITLPGLDTYITAAELINVHGTACFPITPKSNEPYHVEVEREESRAASPNSTFRSQQQESMNVPSNATLKARILRGITDSDLGRVSSVTSKTNQRYNPTTPGVLGTKVYCTHWMRTGECDFTQQGCMFVHCMPDLPTLELLGFRCYPRWFREMSREFQEENAKEFNVEGLTNPARGQPYWRNDQPWRSGRNETDHQGGFRNMHGPQFNGNGPQFGGPGPQFASGNFGGHGPNQSPNYAYPQGPSSFSNNNQFYPQTGYHHSQSGFQNFLSASTNGFGSGNQGFGNTRYPGHGTGPGPQVQGAFTNGPGWNNNVNNSQQPNLPKQTDTPGMSRESIGAQGLPTPVSPDAHQNAKRPGVSILQRNNSVSSQTANTTLKEYRVLTPALRGASQIPGTIGDKQKGPVVRAPNDSVLSTPEVVHPKRFQNPRFIPNAKFQAPDVRAQTSKEKDGKDVKDAGKKGIKPVIPKEGPKTKNAVANMAKTARPFRGSQDIRKDFLTIENVGKIVRETRERELKLKTEQLQRAKESDGGNPLVDLDATAEKDA